MTILPSPAPNLTVHVCKIMVTFIRKKRSDVKAQNLSGGTVLAYLAIRILLAL